MRATGSNPQQRRVRLKSDRIEAIERRHPWLFSGALVATDLRDLVPGQEVLVTTYEGQPLARGYFEADNIAVRILSFGKETEVLDQAFFLDRLHKARSLRERLGLVGEERSYRLVHGEGDLLSGLVIDHYAEVLVMQSHTRGMHLLRGQLASALQALYGDQLKAIYYKSEMAQLPEESDGLLYGKLPDGLVAKEGAWSFVPDIVKGQKTGFFLDQRENRALVERYAKGRKVLNMFCYTGGFTLSALQGGAASVTSVDSSNRAISLLEENLQLNFPADDITKRHESITADAFQYLKEMPDGAYDLIILDPPAFAKKRSAVKNALQGYRKINADALRKIAPGGLLFTFSCSQLVDMTQFRQSLFTAALHAGREVRILQQLHQAADHPVSIYHHEGEYLKGLLLYVE